MPEYEKPENKERKGWVSAQLERWTPFWIMVGGVGTLVVIVLTLVLVSQGSHSSSVPPAPNPTTLAPTTPAPTTPAPVALTYYFDYTSSSQYPCSSEGSVHTVLTDLEDPFDFINNSSTSLQIFWLNTSGNRISKDTLPPGDTYYSDAYYQDAFLIASPNATCEGIFVVDGNGGVTITSSS
jgi:hypothetical protein